MIDNISKIYVAKHKELGNLLKEDYEYFIQVTDLLIKYASYDVSNDEIWMKITVFYNKHKTNMLLW